MYSRTAADCGDPIACGSAATLRRTSMARADENWPAGAEAGSGRGASHGETATAATRTMSATRSEARR